MAFPKLSELAYSTLPRETREELEDLEMPPSDEWNFWRLRAKEDMDVPPANISTWHGTEILAGSTAT